MSFAAPRKRFGQHFLHDRGVVERILSAFNPCRGQNIVEIGPGRGALTLPLLERVQVLHAVEFDRDIVAQLPALAAGRGQLVLHQADALRFNFATLVQHTDAPVSRETEGQERPQHQPLRVIGNLPYNISTPLMFHLLEQSDAIADMLFMVQKEVADRLAAAPGGKDYGRLSVMLQWRCEVETLFDVGPGAFNPPPKVHSSIVRLRPLSAAQRLPADADTLGRVVQAAFAQRRKTLRNGLRGLVDETGFAAAAVDSTRRAETLTLAEFVELAKQIRA